MSTHDRPPDQGSPRTPHDPDASEHTGDYARGTGSGVLRRLLWLYPRAFRQRYGAEMQRTFDDRWVEERRRGPVRGMQFVARPILDVVPSALRERWDQAARSRFVPSLRSTRRIGSAEAGRPLPAARREHMGSMREDVRYGLRFLRRRPGFSAVLLVTLGLGIGMTTAVFSVLYGALYAPLPYDDPGAIVRVGRLHPSIGAGLLPLSPARFQDVRGAVSALTGLEAENARSFVLTEVDQSTRVSGAEVTGGFFDVLGVRAARGRTLTEADAVVGAPAVAVVSDAFWRTRLGANPDVLGSTLRIDDVAHTVVGVMPEDFRWRDGSIWRPFRITEQNANSGNFLRMIGRLAAGADAQRASAELASIWAPLRAAYPQGNEDTELAAQSLREDATRQVRTPLLILAGAAGFVLLIACANVANLLLVRAERRQREVGVRAALGAGRGRLAAQFLTEGLVTSVLGGAFGALIAWLGVRALIGAFGNAVPSAATIAINVPVLAFSLLVSVGTGLLVGLAPALRSGVDFSILREGNRGGTARFTRAGRALVVVEVALALMLVIGAGLLLKSYANVLDSDLGFEADGLVAVNFWFPASRYTENDQASDFLARVTTTLEANPDVRGVTMANMMPIREYGSNYTEIGVEGRDETASFVEIRYVTPSFFETLDIELVHGRAFTQAEARDLAPVRVITRTLARQLFGDDDPLGWRLSVTNTPPEIIGVVEDVRDFGPDETPRPIMYAPTYAGSNFIVRSPRDAGAVAGFVRAAAAQIDPSVSLLRIESMDVILGRATASRRFQLTLIAIFALTALLIACVGIYGVLSYSVEQRTREIGLRMALGARARGVAVDVLWKGGRWALLGVGLGAAGAYGLRETIASQLFDVESFDPVVYAGVGALLLGVAALACLVPARRAAVTDPMRALNVE